MRERRRKIRNPRRESKKREEEKERDRVAIGQIRREKVRAHFFFQVMVVHVIHQDHVQFRHWGYQCTIVFTRPIVCLYYQLLFSPGKITLTCGLSLVPIGYSLFFTFFQKVKVSKYTGFVALAGCHLMRVFVQRVRESLFLAQLCCS